MTTKLAIIGAGGSARDTLDIVDACNEGEERYQLLGFIVDPAYGVPGQVVGGRPILGGLDWLAAHKDDVYAICAIGDSHLRWQTTKRAQERGVRFGTLVHPSVILSRQITIGEGVVIAAGCIITNQTTLADHVAVNVGCTISHDSVLHPFVTLSPGVHISGNVTVGEGAYLGTGANVIHRVRIGEWSIVGAGSAVVRDVPPNTTVVGVPGRVIKARPWGWHSGSERNGP